MKTVLVKFEICDECATEFGTDKEDKDAILNNALTLDELRELVGDCDNCSFTVHVGS